MKIFNEDTIVAIATPCGEGGIGIVRLSGKKSMAIADKIFFSKTKTKPSLFKSHTMHHGYIRNPQTKKISDEVMLAVMRAPLSYTKEDTIEINCHSGEAALKNIVNLLLKYGARLAEPGEFTKRAFLNGRLDLTQAEAVLDIIKAKTERELEASLVQLRGKLSIEIKNIKREIFDVYSHIEAMLDFSDQNIAVMAKKEIQTKCAKALNSLKKLSSTFQEGKVIKNGMKCVIYGKPNVGKSTLMNAFLKEERAIVTEFAGTTRDIISEQVIIGGIVINLFDTAGIKKPDNIIEEKSINKTNEICENADIVLFMLDNNKKIIKKDLILFSKIKCRNIILIINKIDLPQKIDLRLIKQVFKNQAIVLVSAKKEKNINNLIEKIKNIAFKNFPKNSDKNLIVTNMRHKILIDESINYLDNGFNNFKKDSALDLVAADFKKSLDCLSEILGEAFTDELLDNIFSNFCIGK